MKKIVCLPLLVFPLFMMAQEQIDNNCLKIEEELYINALLGDYQDESQILDEMQSCRPNDYESDLHRANYLVKQERYRDALKSLSGFFNHDSIPTSKVAEFHFLLGKCSYGIEEYQQAVTHYNKAMELGYDESDVNFELGYNYTALGEYERSNSYYNLVLRSEPNNSAAWNNTGVNYENLNNDSKSLELTLIADSLSYGNHILYKVNLLKTYRRLKKYKEGAAYGKIAHEQFPLNPEIADQYSWILNCLGENRKAIEISKNTLANNPNDPDLLFRIAYSYGNLGMDDSAVVYYFENLKYGERQYSTYDNLAKTFADHGEFEVAHKYINKSIEIEPNYERSHLHLQEMLVDEHRFEEALEQTKYIDRNFDDHTKYLAYFGYVLMCMERYEEAIPYFLKDMASDTTDTKPYNNIGRCYGKLGMTDKAFRHFDMALERDSNNSYVYHNRASLYADLDEVEKACENLKIAIDMEYNWMIDSNLYKLNEEHCKLNLNRKIIIYGYKGELPQYKDKTFIELIDSDTLFTKDDTAVVSDVASSPRIEKTITDQNEDFQIYPNPTSGKFSIEGAFISPGITVRVYDVQSKLIAEKAVINDRKINLDISGEVGGTYIVVISDQNKVLNAKKIILGK